MGTWCTICDTKDDTWESADEPIRLVYLDEVICPKCWKILEPKLRKIIHDQRKVK